MPRRVSGDDTDADATSSVIPVASFNASRAELLRDDGAEAICCFWLPVRFCLCGDEAALFLRPGDGTHKSSPWKSYSPSSVVIMATLATLPRKYGVSVGMHVGGRALGVAMAARGSVARGARGSICRFPGS